MNEIRTTLLRDIIPTLIFWIIWAVMIYLDITGWLVKGTGREEARAEFDKKHPGLSLKIDYTLFAVVSIVFVYCLAPTVFDFIYCDPKVVKSNVIEFRDKGLSHKGGIYGKRIKLDNGERLEVYFDKSSIELGKEYEILVAHRSKIVLSAKKLRD